MNSQQAKKRDLSEIGSILHEDQNDARRKKMQFSVLNGNTQHLEQNNVMLNNTIGHMINLSSSHSVPNDDDDDDDDDSEDDDDQGPIVQAHSSHIINQNVVGSMYTNQMIRQYEQQRPNILQMGQQQQQQQQLHHQHTMQHQHLQLQHLQSLPQGNILLQQQQQQQQLHQQLHHQHLLHVPVKAKRKSRRKPSDEIDPRVRWTPDMDDRLRAACELHGNSWKDVAAYVGYDKNPSQCHKRWTWYVNPAVASRSRAEWTDQEVAVLRTLVEHNNLRQTGRGLKESINWTLISRELNRPYYDCKNKYKLLLAADMKKGPFTPEEDAIIAERVLSWGNRGNGLWAALEKELCRRSDSIKGRAIKTNILKGKE